MVATIRRGLPRGRRGLISMLGQQAAQPDAPADPRDCLRKKWRDKIPTRLRSAEWLKSRGRLGTCLGYKAADLYIAEAIRKTLASSPVQAAIERGLPGHAYVRAQSSLEQYRKNVGKLWESFLEKAGGEGPYSLWDKYPAGQVPGILQAIYSEAAGKAKAAAQKVRNDARPLLRVIDAIPWPHEYMASWVWRPVAPQTPFFQGIPVEKLRSLTSAGYMKRSHEQISKDVGRWIVENEKNIERNFVILVERFIAHQRAKAESKAERAEKYGKILAAVGVVLSMGVGAVASVASGVVQTAFGVDFARQLGKQQREQFKALQSLMGISDEKMRRFREWVAKNAMRKIGAYTAVVEGRTISSYDTPTDAATAASKAASEGDRMEVLSDGESLGLHVQTSVGAVSVPPAQEYCVRRMSSGGVRQMAQEAVVRAKERVPEKEKEKPKKQGRFPWEILIPIAIAVA